jgi:hypothetical protein
MPRVVLELSAGQQRGLASLAAEYACDIEAVALVGVEELLAAHRRPPTRAARRGRPRRTARATKRRERRARRGTSVQEVSYADVAPPPAARPASSPASDTTAAPSTPSARTYQPKRCPGCGCDFVPTGPRSLTCQRCKDEFAAEGKQGSTNAVRRDNPMGAV